MATRFGKLDNGNYYNEWYGEVGPKTKTAIVKLKWAPADFDMAVHDAGSLAELEMLCKTGKPPLGEYGVRYEEPGIW